MKTTVDIPDGVFRDLLKFTKAKTKREAIVTVERPARAGRGLRGPLDRPLKEPVVHDL